MRLIDADAISESLIWGILAECSKKNMSLGEISDAIIDYIYEQKIAYDVDKVVEELEELKIPYRPQGTRRVECEKDVNSIHNNAIEQAVDILKNHIQ